ncbi:response regulator [Jeotgalibacillus salarius]|uniref:Response regulator n=2 Tax=Jeotgalibacillus salarius TaxID=546023 RepID=A0A4Y8LDL6_9BACL|nr:response regulator [Jeotgalibacillus salarius]
MLIRDTLEDLDAELDFASDGHEALEKLKNEDYHVCVIDNIMPKLSGIEVIENLASDRCPEHIIMLTAMTQQRDQENARNCGIKHFITKPFSPVKLKTFIQDLFDDLK